MSITKDDVQKIAKLSRLELNDEQINIYTDELQKIFQFIDTLNECDVEGVEPLTSVEPMGLRMAKDVVSDGGKKAEILANAPLSDDGYFVVPKVIE